MNIRADRRGVKSRSVLLVRSTPLARSVADSALLWRGSLMKFGALWLVGSLIIAPGGAVSFQGSAASGAAACFADWVWEEIPI